jgi:hypothetical protein
MKKILTITSAFVTTRVAAVIAVVLLCLLITYLAGIEPIIVLD